MGDPVMALNHGISSLFGNVVHALSTGWNNLKNDNTGAVTPVFPGPEPQIP
jgi:hypothetical protein